MPDSFNPLNRAARVLAPTDIRRQQLLASMSPEEQQLERAKAKMLAEMPSEMSGTDIRPMTWLERLQVLPGDLWESLTTGQPQRTNALVPNKSTVAYRPGMLKEQNPFDTEQTLAHELTHVRQMRNDRRPFTQKFFEELGGMMQSYQDRAPEIEAFQAERNREHKGRRYYLLTQQKGRQ